MKIAVYSGVSVAPAAYITIDFKLYKNCYGCNKMLEQKMPMNICDLTCSQLITWTEKELRV